MIICVSMASDRNRFEPLSERPRGNGVLETLKDVGVLQGGSMIGFLFEIC